MEPYTYTNTRPNTRQMIAMATTGTSGSEEFTATPDTYPARTMTASSSIKGLQTIATAVDFADKILITVTQNGRLAHWVGKVDLLLGIIATDT